MRSHFLFSSSGFFVALALAPAPPLERAKKATSRGGSSSRAGLPKGWIQGDWIHSAIRQEDLDDLANGGLIPHGSARLPGKESEP